MNRNTIIVSAMVLIMMTAAALAHGGASGVVKKRMDAMGAMSKVMNSMASMMRGDQPLDAKLVKSHARIIISHSGNSMTKMFPDHSNEKPSEARKEIWSNWEEFSALADRLNKFAGALESAAENGRMMMDSGSSGMMKGGMMGGDSQMPSTKMLASMPVDGVFNMVAQTCSACHTKFRLEKK